MARVLPVGQPANDAERAVIRFLRDEAPAEWTVVTNFELTRNRQVFEVDLAILTDRILFIADTKGTHGRIEVRGGKWYPAGRSHFSSPVAKMRQHAKVVATLLDHKGLGSVWCDGLVILPASDAELADYDRRDSPNAVTLKDLVRRLVSFPVPDGRPVFDISGKHDEITSALGASWTKPQGPRRFGAYEVTETLAEASGEQAGEVSSYRAKRSDQPNTGTYLIQVHTVDPWLPDADRTQARDKIGNPLQALNKLPASPHIVPCIDVLPLEDETGYAVVLKDVHADALRVRLDPSAVPLGADAKRRIVAGVLGGLATAHAYRVVHRHLNLDAVLVDRSCKAMLTGFDYAHTGRPRPPDKTRMLDAYQNADMAYLAPECVNDARHFSTVSDMYAAGVLFHELYVGRDRLPVVLSGGKVHDDLDDATIDPEIRDLIRALLAVNPTERPSARDAAAIMDRLQRGGSGGGRRGGGARVGSGGDEDGSSFDWANPHAYDDLPPGFKLTEKFRVRRRLGKGASGVVYQVFNAMDDTDEAIKIVTKDRSSVDARLKHEYKLLKELARHPNIVRVIDADWLPKGGFPFLRMEFAEGQSLEAYVNGEHRLGPADVRRMLEDCLAGLGHLHGNGVYHCDVKPTNLFWTPDGTRLLDFNAAVSVDSTLTPTLGSPRYQAPDISWGGQRPTQDELADLDLYALGISAYMVLTAGRYPWPNAACPPKGALPDDPRRVTGLGDLSPAFAELLLRALAPTRAERFPDAEAFLTALRALGDEVRVVPAPPDPRELMPLQRRPGHPNSNPFVSHLQTLYSQSPRTNAGTRGLDPAGLDLYIATALDDQLADDVLAGEHRLVVITGNAGDGKTAFLESLANKAVDSGGKMGAPRGNGTDFNFAGRCFRTNHDGSQDQGDTANDQVLDEFLAPYQGAEAESWPDAETRLIAINEGRLVDFLTQHEARYRALRAAIERGFQTGQASDGVAVVNLNARDVVAQPDGPEVPILHRMVGRMAQSDFWAACTGCDIAEFCYARHNAQTFAHPSAGPMATERLADLYRMTSLRGRVHITLRDLRSALAYTLTSARDCAQIHDLYAKQDTQAILDSFYFNSWAGIHTGAGPDGGEQDRLLRQLREVDIAAVPDPQLDRRFDYIGPAAGHSLVSVDQRGEDDSRLLQEAFAALPRTPQSPADAARQTVAHRAYLASARRRFFFESLDEAQWRSMLSYRAGGRFLGLLASGRAGVQELHWIIEAINRGEGLVDPARLGEHALALQVRVVPGGSIRSYRLFPEERFTIEVAAPIRSPYVESSARELVVRYADPDGHQAQLRIRLDLYELLDRLRSGYQPGVEDRQGQNLSLVVFKNALSAAPYQEVLLATSGNELHRISREAGGVLRMTEVEP